MIKSEILKSNYPINNVAYSTCLADITTLYKLFREKHKRGTKIELVISSSGSIKYPEVKMVGRGTIDDNDFLLLKELLSDLE
jgi:hypothetical protein